VGAGAAAGTAAGAAVGAAVGAAAAGAAAAGASSSDALHAIEVVSKTANAPTAKRTVPKRILDLSKATPPNQLVNGYNALHLQGILPTGINYSTKVNK
jgi:hypothetical protein